MIQIGKRHAYDRNRRIFLKNFEEDTYLDMFIYQRQVAKLGKYSSPSLGCGGIGSHFGRSLQVRRLSEKTCGMVTIKNFQQKGHLHGTTSCKSAIETRNIDLLDSIDQGLIP